MATGDPFYYFSSDGAYNASSVNAQNAISGTATTTTYGGLGLLGGITYTGNSAGLPNQFHTAMQFGQHSTLSEYMAKAQEPAKAAKRKIKGLLANLRSEIDGWHDDILDRCPA